MEKILINLEEDYYKKYFKKDIVTLEEILEKVEELDDEIDYLKEAYERLEEELRENYKPIPKHEFYGVSERDFI